MRDLRRIRRLVDYHGQRKDEAALRLGAVQVRINRAERDLTELRRRNEAANESRSTSSRGAVDIHALRIVEDYKTMLRADIDRKRLEIETLLREEAKRREEATEAYKRFKMWEKVKEKQEHDDNDTQRVMSQRELDDASLDKKRRSPRGHEGEAWSPR